MTKWFCFIPARLAAIISVALLVMAMPARAELIVISSNTPAFTAGTKLTDDVQLNLPKGASLKLLKQPEGTTHSLKGPYKGTLKAYANRPKSLWEKLFGRKGSASNPIGGVPDASPPVGGTRGARQPAPMGGTRGIK